MYNIIFRFKKNSLRHIGMILFHGKINSTNQTLSVDWLLFLPRMRIVPLVHQIAYLLTNISKRYLSTSDHSPGGKGIIYNLCIKSAVTTICESCLSVSSAGCEHGNPRSNKRIDRILIRNLLYRANHRLPRIAAIQNDYLLFCR